jgi:hypothetical protein
MIIFVLIFLPADMGGWETYQDWNDEEQNLIIITLC